MAVPAVARDHPDRARCLQVIARHEPTLAGHASIETYSVLTRLPGGGRLDPLDVWRLLQTYFPRVVWPTSETNEAFLERCAHAGVVGGAVYDALVAVTALSNGAKLVTLDRRAHHTYRAMGVEAVSPRDLA